MLGVNFRWIGNGAIVDKFLAGSGCVVDLYEFEIGIAQTDADGRRSADLQQPSKPGREIRYTGGRGRFDRDRRTVARLLPPNQVQQFFCRRDGIRSCQNGSLGVTLPVRCDESWLSVAVFLLPSKP